MFAQRSRIDVCWADTEMCGEQRAEPGGVEDGARPNDPFRRNTAPARDCRDNLGHHVNRIGRHQKNRVRRRRQYRRHDLCEDFGVARQQMQPAFPRPLVSPRSKHDQTHAIKISKLARADADRIGKRRSVQNVARLCDRQIRVAIDKQDPRTDTAHHHGISRSGADMARSDDADFHGVPSISMSELYPRTSADGQLAPRADAPAPHRLRQPSPAASLMPAGRTMSVEKKKTEPECGFGAPGTKIETSPLLNASV